MSAIHARAFGIGIREYANTTTHALGLLLAMVGGLLPVSLHAHGGDREVRAIAIFAAALIATYAASTLYHAESERSRKRRLRVIDRSLIYILIAATYGALMATVLPPPLGTWISAAVWAGAVAGVVDVVTNPDRRSSPVWPYCVLACVIILAARPFLAHASLAVAGWVVLGGAFYLSGVVFFKRDGQFDHAIWHLLVIAGSICHYTAIATSA